MSQYISTMTAAGTLTGDELLEVSQLSTTVTKTATTISAAASDNSYNDSGSGFVAAGFTVGDRVKVTGFTGNVANNIMSGKITALTTAKMTIGGTDGDVIVDDAAGESVTITRWDTRRATAQDIADLGGGGGPASVRTYTGTSDALVLGDANNIVESNNAGANTLEVPPNSSVAFAVGTSIAIAQIGSGQTTMLAGIGVTIRSSGSKLKLTGQYSGATLYKRATDEWVLVGDISA